jgi:hypothetical protein
LPHEPREVAAWHLCASAQPSQGRALAHDACPRPCWLGPPSCCRPRTAAAGGRPQGRP